MEDLESIVYSPVMNSISRTYIRAMKKRSRRTAGELLEDALGYVSAGASSAISITRHVNRRMLINGAIGLVLLGTVATTAAALSRSGRGSLNAGTGSVPYFPTPAVASRIDAAADDRSPSVSALESRVEQDRQCSPVSADETLSVLLNGDYCFTPDTINQILRQNRSPAIDGDPDIGQFIYNMGRRYDIEPAVFLAFFANESGFGKAGIARKTRSAGNIRPGRSWTGNVYHTERNGAFREYTSWRDGIEDWFRLIRNSRHYVAGGKTTVEEIVPKYAPNNPDAYIGKVRKFYNEFIQMEINSSGEKAHNHNSGLDIVSEAESYMGTPYNWGGNDPDAGIDCSRLVQLAFKSVGIRLPRTSRSQFNYGTPVSMDELIPGDVVFFDTIHNSRPVDHVGIYSGGGKFIHASSSRGKVTTSDIHSSYWTSRFVGARRMTD